MIPRNFYYSNERAIAHNMQKHDTQPSLLGRITTCVGFAQCPATRELIVNSVAVQCVLLPNVIVCSIPEFLSLFRTSNTLKPVILNELLLQKKPPLPLDKPKTISYGIAVNYLLQYSETEHK